MTLSRPGRAHAAVVSISALLALAACAGGDLRDPAAAVNPYAAEQLGASVAWHGDTQAQRDSAAQVDRLLSQPLTADNAVRIALINSPALQSLMAQAVVDSAQAAQGAQLPNPVLSLSKLVRGEGDARELAIDRAISVSLVSLLSLPARAQRAGAEQARLQLQLTDDVVRVATQARLAWVQAVAAQEQARYAQTVLTAAQAGGELARRMEAAGNFSALQSAREQTFASDAQAASARGAQAALSRREALVRTLGLSDAQAARLQLPEHLPDLPAAAPDAAALRQSAFEQRLDVQMARAQLKRVAQEQGVTQLDSLLGGLDIGWQSNSETGKPTQQGFELSIALPIFDAGNAQRAQARAAVVAAAQHSAQVEIDARSQLREAQARWQTSYSLARHYQDDVLPRRQAIADHMVRQYNGMLIGVFELLADARERVDSVNEAQTARRDFWLADAALHTALLGQAAPNTND